ncbi:MAG TPA: beta-propeller fold lactonase family protein [Candidatus Binatia bacterium]|nr:beta-propeller fold lactonase family protein [Candidatus Binatia bacterium]
MRNRLTCIGAVSILIASAALVACSSKYSPSSNGLIIVPSNASIAMETLSLDLTNGATSQINNVNGPPLDGEPGQVILNPSGTYAYVLIYQNSAVTGGGTTGIDIFPVQSDGKLGTGSAATLNQTLFMSPTNGCEMVSETPIQMATDSAGKYLFVANSGTADPSGLPVPGSVSVLSIGTNGSLAEVNPVSCTNPSITGSPFPLPLQQAGRGNPTASALAVTSTVYPQFYAFCSSGQTPPSTEYLYVTDFNNNVLLNYSVSSSGGLTLNTTSTGNGVPTGVGPSGVAVDPCNRFAFVSNATSNNVSAYTICDQISTTAGCALADFSLHAVANSPYAAGDLPGPIAVDAYGNFVYAVDTGSNQVTSYRIGPGTGALTFEGNWATNINPNSIAIRSDDSWIFVANATSGNLSQYSINLTTGGLTAITTPVQTLNTPTGVAVK